MNPLTKVCLEYHCMIMRKTGRYAYKQKPGLFKNIKDIAHVKASELLPIIIKEGFLYDFFRFCEPHTLYSQFCIIYDKDFFGVATKEYVERALLKLYEDSKLEQASFPTALVIEQIFQRRGIKYVR